jgi:hypothetical protein
MNRLLIAAVLAGMTAGAQAASFGVVPQAGLAGVGATVQWGFTPYLAMSAGYTALDYSVKDVKTDEATYNGDLSLRNPQAFLNWAPFGGHFRLSAGLINQQSSFDLTASDFKDPQSSPVSAVNIKANYAQSVAPALTFGWESPIMSSGLGYHLSVGAMYAGEPDVETDSTCKGGFTQTQCDVYTANERKKVEDELRSYKVLPILQAGLIYRM